jgi:hypothetical protein
MFRYLTHAAADALIALALALSASVAIPASAAASDASATAAYLRANMKLVQVANSHLAASEKAPQSEVLARVRRECPHAGANSPQNPESTHMSYEVIGAIVIAAYKFDLQAAREYVRAVRPLHWSSASVTREVREHAQDLTTVAALAPPNLCADVAAWKASGYHSLPSSTLQFDKKFEPSWVKIGLLPEGLGRFESGATRALARRALQIEELLEDGEARVAETGYEPIMDALELWP